MKGKPGCRVYLLRHGETANARQVCLNGHFDVALSDQGWHQSRQLAQALKDMPIHSIYSSDLQRAHEGARLIAEPHNLEPQTYPELRELSFGNWEGLSVKELHKKYPGEMEQRLKDTEDFRAEGGESFQELQARVVPKFEEIIARHPEDQIVVMCHGGVIRTLLSHILGMPVSRLFRISQEYAAVNIIQFYPDQPVVELTNGTHHQISL